MADDFQIIIISDHFPRLLATVPGVARLVLEKTAADIEAYAKAIVPVDTGALKNSIHWYMEGDDTAVVQAGDVRAGVEYAMYVEYGTCRMAAQPYMTPAAKAVEPSFQKAVAVAIQQWAAAGTGGL